MTHPYDFCQQLLASNWFNKLKPECPHFWSAAEPDGTIECLWCGEHARASIVQVADNTAPLPPNKRYASEAPHNTEKGGKRDKDNEKETRT